MFGQKPPAEPRPMEPNGTCRWCGHCHRWQSSADMTGVCDLDDGFTAPWGKCPSFEPREAPTDVFGYYRRA
ncbi:hypothetical protein AAY81_04030 [Denitrobacterium detoxificans]|uniref:Uncharacterized protein n=1 Tax=Denitrobacterium detoxificans TaxID=79604 RepID=A0A172RXI6_9ACTN|nr:hypothetical protein AAY81_04030 [Denitrobacterium detoxificans]SEO81710.1 hypothetical protein SAMN02910314_01304 [Denitrobacterium detoxificans]SEP01671.1 hypothetical protein SAMN02910314_01928 [Denitrobacterium detoxificans]